MTATELLAIRNDGIVVPLSVPTTGDGAGDVVEGGERCRPDDGRVNFTVASSPHAEWVGSVDRATWRRPRSGVTARSWRGERGMVERRFASADLCVSTDVVRNVGPQGTAVWTVHAESPADRSSSGRTIVTIGHPGRLLRTDGFWVNGLPALAELGGAAVFVDLPPPHEVGQLVIAELLDELALLEGRPILAGLSADAFLIASAHAALGHRVGGCVLRSPLLDPDRVDRNPAAQYWTASIGRSRNATGYVAPGSLLDRDRPCGPLLVQIGRFDGRVGADDGVEYAVACRDVGASPVATEFFDHGHSSLLPVTTTKQAAASAWSFIASIWEGAR